MTLNEQVATLLDYPKGEKTKYGQLFIGEDEYPFYPDAPAHSWTASYDKAFELVGEMGEDFLRLNKKINMWTAVISVPGSDIRVFKERAGTIPEAICRGYIKWAKSKN